MKPRILFLGSYPPPFGGISSHLHALLPHLVSHGYQCDLLSPGPGRTIEPHDGFTVYRMPKDRWDAARHILPSVARVAIDAIRLRALDETFFMAQAIADLADRVIRQNGRPSVISSYHLLPWGLAGALVADRHDLPLVTTNFGEIYADRPFYQQRSDLVNRIVRRSSALMSSSRHCGNSYRTIGVDADVNVVPYGVDLVAFGPHVSRDEARRKFGVPDDSPLAVFVGRMIRDMGLHTFIAATTRLLTERPEARFIIGGAKGGMTPDAEKLAAESGGRVSVFIDVPFKDLAGLYAAADAIVAPTLDDRACMGLAIKEAMATGRAVVSTRVGGVPEAVVDGETGRLVTADQPDELGNALGELLGDLSRCRAMGDSGRRRCLELFDVGQTNQRVQGILEGAFRR